MSDKKFNIYCDESNRTPMVEDMLGFETGKNLVYSGIL